MSDVHEAINRERDNVIKVPELARTSIEPLVTIIEANKGRRVTEAVVRLAMLIGEQCGRMDALREMSYAAVERSTDVPVHWKGSFKP